MVVIEISTFEVDRHTYWLFEICYCGTIWSYVISLTYCTVVVYESKSSVTARLLEILLTIFGTME